MTRLFMSALLAIAILSGCGGDKTVDTSQVEDGIDSQLSTSTAKATAKCPSDVQVEKGATFTCDVTWSNGAGGKVVVTQQGGNRYTYAVKDGSVNVPGEAVDKNLEQDLAQSGYPDAQVECPSNIVVKLDSPVTCNVSGLQGKATGEVTFTFSEADGSVDSSSVTVS